MYLFDHVQQVTAVAIRHRDQRLPGLVGQRQWLTEERFGAAREGAERGVVEALQDEDLAAGQQGADEFEAGVLRGRADEDDGAVFDVGKERVLLGAVEAVDLVDEQHRPLTHLAPALRNVEHFAEVGDAGESGGERLEREVCLLGEEPRDRRLPAPGRPPQHH